MNCPRCNMPLWMSTGIDFCRGCGDTISLVPHQPLPEEEKARRYDRLDEALRLHAEVGNKYAFRFWLQSREQANREGQLRVNWVAHDFLQGFIVGVAWLQQKLDGFPKKLQ